jgi:hypothetical protein
MAFNQGHRGRGYGGGELYGRVLDVREGFIGGANSQVDFTGGFTGGFVAAGFKGGFQSRRILRRRVSK